MGIKLKELRRGDIILYKDYVGIVAMTKMSMSLIGQMNVLVYFIGEDGEIKRDVGHQYPDYEINAIRE